MKEHRRLVISLVILVVLVVIGGSVVYIDRNDPEMQNVLPSSSPQQSTGRSSKAPQTEVIAENLNVPWDLAFMPDGDILITERNGKIKRLFLTTDKHVEDVLTVPGVVQTGESGLHGIAVHPNFKDNNYIYLYYTFSGGQGNSLNRVVRYTYSDGTLKDMTVIVDNIPGAIFHDGGRIRFGPDGYLYIATGDAQVPTMAQDRNFIAGKILRVTDSGKPAPGNPFGNMIYSLGHRNPQGLTWDDKGNLWETEHGPSGSGDDCCRDEVNLIRPGANYGWPEITGDRTQNKMVSPIAQSGADTIWAPASVIYANNSLFFAGLRGQALFEAVIGPNNTITEVIPHFQNRFGRIRGATMGPDGMLYITTSNRDGRGIPKTGDDKIIRINLEKI